MVSISLSHLRGLLVLACTLASAHAQQAVFSPPSSSLASTNYLSHGLSGSLVHYTFQLPQTDAQVAHFTQDISSGGGDIWHLNATHADVFVPSSVDSSSFSVSTYLDKSGFMVTTESHEISFPPPTSPFASASASASASSSTHLSKHAADFDYDLTALNTSYHASYQPLTNVSSFSHTLASLHPELVSVSTYGYSYEGRPLEVVRIADQARNRTMGVRPVVVVGPMHAREWIATATSTYLVHTLVMPSNTTGSLRHMLDNHDVYIIPVPNPDGYVHTWTADRLWYKNRQQTMPVAGEAARCVGVDLARNWGYKWRSTADGPGFASQEEEYDEDDLGDYDEDSDFVILKQKPKRNRRPQIPTTPCSTGYPGSRPFDAPETSALDLFIRTLPRASRLARSLSSSSSSLGNDGNDNNDESFGPTLPPRTSPYADPAAFLELRSYGQTVSVPYAHSCKRYPKDAETLMELATGAAAAARRGGGVGYSVGRLCEQTHRANGNVLDWAYHTAGVQYAYTVRLRDTGTYGFALPPSEIRATGAETAEMVAYLARFVKERK